MAQKKATTPAKPRNRSPYHRLASSVAAYANEVALWTKRLKNRKNSVAEAEVQLAKSEAAHKEAVDALVGTASGPAVETPFDE